MHLGSVKPEDVREGSFNYYTVTDRRPKYSIVDTPYGSMYGAYRPADEGNYYWRVAQFLFPFYTQIPTGVLGHQILTRAPSDPHPGMGTDGRRPHDVLLHGEP